jgi:hypothetical protein
VIRLRIATSKTQTLFGGVLTCCKTNSQTDPRGRLEGALEEKLISEVPTAFLRAFLSIQAHTLTMSSADQVIGAT